jgi:putative flippase GtrA
MIGVFNTLFDFALYIVIYDATNSIVVANLAATSAALVGSYILNSRITFKAKRWTMKSLALFVGVTLLGLWIFQTGIIYALTPVINHIPEHVWRHLGDREHVAKTISPKIVAVAITFIWNFLWYSKVIFKKDENRTEEAIRVAEL